MPFHRFHNSGSVPDVTVKESKVKVFCNFHKRKIILFLLIGILAITGSVLTWYFTRHIYQIPQFEEMERDMDKYIDPCSDFYKYSCGNYIKKYLPNPITGSVVYQNKFLELGKKNVLDAKSALDGMAKTSDPVFKKAYSYYDTCMNGARSMDIFWNAAADIGGSQITSKSFSMSSWNSDDALWKMKKLYNANPLFTVDVGTDLLNSSRNVILIKPPDTALISKLALEDYLQGKAPKYPGYVLEDDIDETQELVKNFKLNVKELFITAAATRTGKMFSSIRSSLDRALTFESDLIADIVSTMKGMVLHKIYKQVTISSLKTLTRNKIDWVKVLSKITSGYSASQITNSTVVGLMVPTSYLSKVADYLSKSYWYDKRDKLPSFFAWTLLKKLSPVLPNDYFAAYYFNAKAYDIGTSGKERWRACMLDTEMRMPLTIGMMFTKKVISDDTNNKTAVLLNEVKNAFHDGIDNVPWLDTQTRAAVRNKLNYLLYIIANPNMINSSSLMIRYKAVKTRTDNLGQFFLSCERNVVDINLLQLKKPVSRERIGKTTTAMKLYDVNAFYDRSKNRITVLAGILRSPFFYTSGPSYINFGKLASILGHEMLHGYDSLGWYYDKTGQIAPWWTKAASDAFDVRKKCVESQYSNYLWGSSYVDGKKTLAENIADHGGLKYAYLAYKSWAKKNPNEKKPADLKKLSYDQLFFLAYAQMWCQAASLPVRSYLLKTDTHSPNRYRVIGSLSNFGPFSTAYKCAKGDTMNPYKKCPFW